MATIDQNNELLPRKYIILAKELVILVWADEGVHYT